MPEPTRLLLSYRINIRYLATIHQFSPHQRPQEICTQRTRLLPKKTVVQKY